MEMLWQTQKRSIASGLLSGVFLVTAVVLSRRISGDAAAFTSELAACLTGIAASLVAVLSVSVPDLLNSRLSPPQRSLLVAACGIPGVMLGLALMPAGSSTGMACLLGLYLAAVVTVSAFEGDNGRNHSGLRKRHFVEPVAASVSVSLFDEPSTHVDEHFDHSPTGQPDDTPPTFRQAEPASVIASAEHALSDGAALAFDLNAPIPHPSCSPETTQWMSRSVVDGRDVAEGSFRVRFAAGQRLAPVHLPFSPPLADTPSFECEPADESELRFRTTALHAYGIRIEVSRSTECELAATVEVAWTAIAALSESVAA